jgi:phosphoglycolate phosphatase-like HAD superfamily hydrolase
MSSLTHWNESAGTQALLAAIDQQVEPKHPGFVPPAERSAAIDNDGTLWCEKPMYVQIDFVLRRWKGMLKADPGLASKQPYKALAEQDLAWFGRVQEQMPVVLEAIGDAFSGISPEQYAEQVAAFFAQALHPIRKVPYQKMVYPPMRELLDYLRSRQYRVYITTGGERDFVRVISDAFYGIPPEDVIGTAGDLEYANGELIRVARMSLPANENAGKPVHFHNRTGQRPALAIGNSDGDFEMLEYARIGVILRHDDAEREFAYNEGAERVLQATVEQKWITLSMKQDFATVFGA